PRDYTLTLRDRAVLGRGPHGCDLIIEGDPEISTLHCLLIRQNGQLVLRDLNSTNGTLVNGVPIHGEYRLSDRDTVLLGNTELRLLPGVAP
nr:FHA domain-containing protein [Candidatus Contendobacter sp.]